MMSVRVKLQLTQKNDNISGNPQSKQLKFSAVYDPTIPEDQRFAKSTPIGEFTIVADNSTALEALRVGQFCYADVQLIPA